MSRTVYVTNVPFQANCDDLRDYFSIYGLIQNIHVPMDVNTKRSRGFAFVKFYTIEDAANVINKWNEPEMFGRKLKIRIAINPKMTTYKKKFEVYDVLCENVGTEISSAKVGCFPDKTVSHSSDEDWVIV